VSNKGQNAMREMVDVQTGEFAVRRGGCLLRAVALGSCIAVTAFDTRVSVAGLAHIMLPGPGPGTSVRDTRYAESGIAALLNRMTEEGSRTETLEICLVGAGNVLRNPDDTICRDNIRSVTEILCRHSIPIRASVLGGFERKSAFLDSGTGQVFFTEGNGEPQILWGAECRGTDL
jgi:chemotaxis protein CheD